MNESLREQLSALTDGEMGRDALRFVLKGVGDDPKMAGVWSRYQLMGATLRRHDQAIADAGFSRRVLAGIAAGTDVDTMPASDARGGWMRWASGGAIAAGVAAMALFVARGPVAEIDPVAPAAPTLAREVNVPSSELHASVPTLPAAGEGTSSSSVLWDPRMQGYLLQHGRVAGQLGQEGFVPYVYLMATPSPVPADGTVDERLLRQQENDAR